MKKYDIKNKRIYSIWRGMKFRCDNPKSNQYSNYGGKGIRVCNDWLDFHIFQNWALSNGYADHLTLDRKNNNGHYCPENCQWISSKEQNRKRTNNHNITYNGITKCLMAWADDSSINIKPDTFKRRLLLGWSIEDALTKKLKRYKVYHEYQNELYTVDDLSKHPDCVVNKNTLISRIYTYNWSLEQALKTPIKSKNKDHD
jgi:hypothetical protein